jgi:hypothetical protein
MSQREEVGLYNRPLWVFENCRWGRVVQMCFEIAAWNIRCVAEGVVFREVGYSRWTTAWIRSRKSCYAFQARASQSKVETRTTSITMYTSTMDTLELLLSTPSPPPFIYIHHPHQPTSSLTLTLPPASARVDAIECHTAKLLWSTIISRLEGKDAGVVDSLDMFIRRLRVFAEGSESGKGKNKGKGKEREAGKRFSIVVTKAERLPKVMGSGWAVTTRLAELVSPSCIYTRGELINRLESH